MSRSQIRALVSNDIKAQVDRYTDAHGMKRGAFIESALLYHLQALREPPLDHRALHPWEMSKDAVKALTQAEAPAEAAAFDREIKTKRRRRR